MRTVSTAILLVAVALAGCSDDAPADDPTTTTSTSSTTSPPIKVNTAPTANLTASAGSIQAGDVVLFNVRGSDLDGDRLTWTLDADGDDVPDANGTTLPATVNFTYAAPGVFNATLIVDDGHNATTAALAITVTEALPSGPIFEWEGSAALPCLHCSLFYEVCVGYNAGSNGEDCVWTPIPPATGHVATITSSEGIVNADFMATCDGSPIDYLAGETSPWQGTIPDGTGCVLLYEADGGVGADFTIVIQ